LRREPYIGNNRTTYKYYDGINLKTCKYENYENISELIDFLQCHYIGSDRVLMTGNKKTFDSYFTGQNNPSLISVYKIKSELEGSIGSRAINMYFSNTKSSVYYIDFICIHHNLDKKIVYNLIQTHECNQRYINPDIKISMFKKEISLI
jgi:hypothetical protein